MKINGKILDKWASILLGHSLGGISPADTVMIKGEAVAWPLISVLQEKILKAGAMADVFIVPPDNERGKAWGATAARILRPDRFKSVPAWQKLRHESFTKHIEILGMGSPELTRGVYGPSMRKIDLLNSELLKIRRAKPWVLTLFPTPAFAGIEGLSFSVYTDVLLKASTQDPRVLNSRAARLARLLGETQKLRVITRNPKAREDYELRISLAESIMLNDTEAGYHNIPCGEVFTSPDASSVEGQIFLDMPISMQGDVIQGVYLKFAAGKVVSFRAVKGFRRLAHIIGTDSGSRRLGEVAFGLNPSLTVPLMHPLFCEKTAGTMHFALGNCFPDGFSKKPDSKKGAARFCALLGSGVANASSQHTDLVVSFRKGGAGRAVFLDDRRLELRDGNWAPGS